MDTLLRILNFGLLNINLFFLFSGITSGRWELISLGIVGTISGIFTTWKMSKPKLEWYPTIELIEDITVHVTDDPVSYTTIVKLDDRAYRSTTSLIVGALNQAGFSVSQVAAAFHSLGKP